MIHGTTDTADGTTLGTTVHSTILGITEEYTALGTTDMADGTVTWVLTTQDGMADGIHIGTIITITHLTTAPLRSTTDQEQAQDVKRQAQE